MEQADDLERKLADGELDPATGKPWYASKRKKMEATLKNTLARQDKIQTKIAELKIKLTESELKMTEIDKVPCTHFTFDCLKVKVILFVKPPVFAVAMPKGGELLHIHRAPIILVDGLK